jgi:hypothetical protein
MENLKTVFAKRLAEKIEQMPVITPETLAEMLIESGILSERRVSQFCAVCELYDTVGLKTKTQSIKELSEKYNVSERLLVQLSGKEKRFQI